MVYGYARVSSADQNTDRQLIALMEAGVKHENIYTDKMSGNTFNRPQYTLLKQTLKAQDTLYILSIDRLGRNYEEIRDQWRMLTKDVGIDIRVLDMPLLDTRGSKDLIGTFIADLVLEILSFVAQAERESIKKRQAQGIRAAKARGVQFGRRKKPLPGNFDELIESYRQQQMTKKEILAICDISASTFFRRLREKEMLS